MKEKNFTIVVRTLGYECFTAFLTVLSTFNTVGNLLVIKDGENDLTGFQKKLLEVLMIKKWNIFSGLGGGNINKTTYYMLKYMNNLNRKNYFIFDDDFIFNEKVIQNILKFVENKNIVYMSFIENRVDIGIRKAPMFVNDDIYLSMLGCCYLQKYDTFIEDTVILKKLLNTKKTIDWFVFSDLIFKHKKIKPHYIFCNDSIYHLRYSYSEKKWVSELAWSKKVNNYGISLKKDGWSIKDIEYIY